MIPESNQKLNTHMSNQNNQTPLIRTEDLRPSSILDEPVRVRSTIRMRGSHKPTCQNCQTNTTPLWRRDEQGEILCNACGLFFKLHGRARPIWLKTDTIKSRHRNKCDSAANKPEFSANDPRSPLIEGNKAKPKGRGKSKNNGKKHSCIGEEHARDSKNSLYLPIITTSTTTMISKDTSENTSIHSQAACSGKSAKNTLPSIYLGETDISTHPTSKPTHLLAPPATFTKEDASPSRSPVSSLPRAITHSSNPFPRSLDHNVISLPSKNDTLLSRRIHFSHSNSAKPPLDQLAAPAPSTSLHPYPFQQSLPCSGNVPSLQSRVSELEFVNNLLLSRISELESAQKISRESISLVCKSELFLRVRVKDLENKSNSFAKQIKSIRATLQKS